MQRIGTQVERLGDVAGEAGAQVTGTRADDDRVHLARRDAGRGEGVGGRPRGELRRVREEALVQRIGIEFEALVERVQGERAPFDAVVVVEDALEDGARARCDLRALGALQCLPALGLREAAWGHGGAQPYDMHRRESADRRLVAGEQALQGDYALRPWREGPRPR